MVAWEYQIESQQVKRFGNTQWVILEQPVKSLRTLTPFELPPPEAVAAIADIDQENMLALRPNDQISIDVQIPKDPILTRAVHEALSLGLTQAGMQVAENQPLQLVATLSHGKTEQVTYQSFDAINRERETVSVTDRVYKLEIQKNGVPIWDRTFTMSSPMHIRLQENESIREGVTRVMTPKKEYFQGRLPTYVVKPEHQKPLGKSKLSLGL